MLTGAGGFAPHGTVSPPTGTRNPDPIASGQRLFFSLSPTRNEAANGEISLPNGELFMPLQTRKPDEKRGENASPEAVSGAIPVPSFVRRCGFAAAGLCPLQDR